MKARQWLIASYRCGGIPQSRKVLELVRLRLSIYIMCEFSATRLEEGDISLDGQVVAKKDTFPYLGSMLQKDGEDVRYRISAGWLKWR